MPSRTAQGDDRIYNSPVQILSSLPAMTDEDHASKKRAPAEIRRREFLLGMMATCGLPPSYLSGHRPFHPNWVATPQIAGMGSDDAVKKLMTANSDFFIRNHFRVPKISAENWNLEIGGLVTNPLKFSYPDLLLASSVRRPLTLECAGNVSGGAGVSTAFWSGLPLAGLLRQAGAHAGQGIAHILAGRRGASLAKRIMSEVEVGLLIRAARPSGIACCLRSSMLEDPASPKRCP